MIKILTVSGIEVDLENYDPSIIPIQDSIFSLSVARRFGNCGRKFLSVAEHQMNAYKLAKYFRYSEEICKACLIHDKQEAEFIDLPSPIKYSGMVDRYVELEHNAMMVNFKYYLNLDYFPKQVKYIDHLLLVWEAKYTNNPIYNYIKLEYLNVGDYKYKDKIVDDLNSILKFVGYEPKVIERLYTEKFNEVIGNDKKRIVTTQTW